MGKLTIRDGVIMSEKPQNSIVLKEKNGERQLLDLGAIESKITAFTEAVPQLSHSKKMFGRTGSQYTSQLMSLTMLGDGPFHFMKQCMAQIEKKKNALRESYFRMKKTAYKIKQWEEKGDEYSLILAEEAKIGLVESQDSIEHAMREIKMYQEAYDEIAESYGIDDSWDEADFLKMEEENHVRMAFRLAVRRLMEQDSIDRATSEYMEANGIHPMAGERLARQYCDEVKQILDEGKAPPIKHFHAFLDRMVEIFQGSYKDTMERVGIKSIIREQATLLGHDHEDLGLYLEHHGYKNAETKMLENNAVEQKKLEG